MKTLDQVKVAPDLRPGQWFANHYDDGSIQHAWDVTRANVIMATSIQDGTMDARAQLWPISDELRASGPLHQVTDAWRQADVERCCIVVKGDAGTWWIIDGWHRARRAIEEGYDGLPVFILTPEEDRDIRICDCCRSWPAKKLAVCRLYRMAGLPAPRGSGFVPATCDNCGRPVWADPAAEAKALGVLPPYIKLQSLCSDCAVALTMAQGGGLVDRDGVDMITGRRLIP